MSSNPDGEPAYFTSGPPPYTRDPADIGGEAAQTSCNDPDHAKIFQMQMLMKLFHYSDTELKWLESLDEWNKDACEGAMEALDELAKRIKEICLVAQQSDPSLEMVEGSEPCCSDLSDLSDGE